MSTFEDPPPNPETPWEFFPDDDSRVDPGESAEDSAMHVVGTEKVAQPEEEAEDVVVHYLEDEHPEVADKSAPRAASEEPGEVEDLLIRQGFEHSRDATAAVRAQNPVA